MILKVLGSSGSEMPNFRSPGFIIDDVLMLDAGTIGGVLSESEQWKIRNILITHAHLDHIKGIPFLADNLVIKNKKHLVEVWSTAPVIRSIKRNMLNDSVWPDFTRIPNAKNPVIKLNAIKKKKPFEIKSYKVTAIGVTHAVPAVGYVIEDKHGKRLMYTGDTGPTEELWKETKNHIHCLIVEVSFPNRMEALSIKTGHLTARLLKNEIRKMTIIPSHILITHPKPQYRRKILGEVAALGYNNIQVLSDGEEFSF